MLTDEPNEKNEKNARPESAPPSSPYGPQPGHVDDASGGADSSPFETLSSDERAERLKQAREQQSPPDNTGARH